MSFFFVLCVQMISRLKSGLDKQTCGTSLREVLLLPEVSRSQKLSVLRCLMLRLWEISCFMLTSLLIFTWLWSFSFSHLYDKCQNPFLLCFLLIKKKFCPKATLIKAETWPAMHWLTSNIDCSNLLIVECSIICISALQFFLTWTSCRWIWSHGLYLNLWELKHFHLSVWGPDFSNSILKKELHLKPYNETGVGGISVPKMWNLNWYPEKSQLRSQRAGL